MGEEEQGEEQAGEEDEPAEASVQCQGDAVHGCWEDEEVDPQRGSAGQEEGQDSGRRDGSCTEGGGCEGEADGAGAGAEAEGAAGSKGRNAFGVLMEGQRRKAQGLGPGQVFYLERTDEGGWRWHWRDAKEFTGGTERRAGVAGGREEGPGMDWRTAGAAGRGLQGPGGTAETGSVGGSGSGVPEGQPVTPAPTPTPPTPPIPPPAWAASTGASLARGSPAATVVLQTNVPPGAGGTVSPDDVKLRSNCVVPPEGAWRGGTPVLKSALQKNVRLRRAPCAVRCAVQLLKDDPGELLRRLVVVCLEDGM